MNLFDLVLLALETIAQLAANAVFGLGGDGTRIAALVALVAKFGRKGNEAVPELRDFTDEIQAILAAGTRVSPERWDELTAKRHADLDRIRGSVGYIPPGENG